MPHTHYISKLVFELKVSAQEEAYEQQNNVAVMVRNELNDVLSHLLDKYDQPGKVIRISKVEIDIADVSFNTIGVEIIPVLKQKLEEEFQRILFRHELNKTVTERGISMHDDLVFITDHETELTQAILYFFQHGYLPAWVNYPENFSISQSVKLLSHNQKKMFIGEMLKLVARPDVINRIFTQLPEVSIKEIIPQLVHASQSIFDEFKSSWIEAVVALPECKKHLLGFIAIHSKYRYRKEIYFKSLLHHLHNSQSDQEIEKLFFLLHRDETYFVPFIKIFSGFKDIPKEVKLKIIQSLQNNSSMSSHHPILHEVYRELTFLSRHSDSQENIIKDDASFSPDDDFQSDNLIPGLENLSDEKFDFVPDESFFKREEKLKDEFSIYKDDVSLPYQINNEVEILIFHAGLVILQPYLLQFFRTLGLVEANQFINPMQQHHAVYILNYIATGIADQPEEHKLVLHKLLCGIDIEAPLLPFQGLTENEIIECENLLQSVIDNWPALKQTSVQALRGSFIDRAGVLRHESSGWMIHIEKVTIDVLLDKLPWGISMFRSPWNKEMIFVEW